MANIQSEKSALAQHTKIIIDIHTSIILSNVSWAMFSDLMLICDFYFILKPISMLHYNKVVD